MRDLTFEDQWLIEKECKDCVKFRGDHCLVLSEFWCLSHTERKCPAKETNLFAWKKTLQNILQYNLSHMSFVENSWIFKELARLEEKMSSEIGQCRFEDEHRSVKRGKSESGRDKSYKSKGKIVKLGGDFPDFER